MGFGAVQLGSRGKTVLHLSLEQLPGLLSLWRWCAKRDGIVKKKKKTKKTSILLPTTHKVAPS